MGYSHLLAPCVIFGYGFVYRILGRLVVSMPCVGQVHGKVHKANAAEMTKTLNVQWRKQQPQIWEVLCSLRLLWFFPEAFFLSHFGSNNCPLTFCHKQCFICVL